jgi:DNA polymerase I
MGFVIKKVDRTDLQEAPNLIHNGLNFSDCKIFACDTETTGLDYRTTDRPFAFSMTDYDGKSYFKRFEVDKFNRSVILSSERDQQDFLKLKTFFEDPTKTFIFHNAKFDIGMIKALGIEVKGKILDTKVFAHTADSTLPMGLKPLTKKLFKHSDQDQTDLKESVRKARAKGKALGWLLSEDVEADYHLGEHSLLEKYAVEDTERTMKLFWYFEEYYNTDEVYRRLVDMEHQVQEVTAKMEDRGIGLDMDVVEQCFLYYTEIVHNETINIKLELAEQGLEDLNTKSAKQMQSLFYDKLKATPVYRVRKKPDGTREKTLTTDSGAMTQWAKEGVKIASSIVAKNEAQHQLISFIQTFQNSSIYKNGNYSLHPNYNSNGPVTGRISCTKPNLMNISNTGTKKSYVKYLARNCFAPRQDKSRKKKVFFFADYDQVEVWIAMFLSKDELGMKMLLDGADMHGDMARKLWGHLYDFSDAETFKKWRKKAKLCLFGLIYGAGTGAIQNTVGCTMEEAKEIRTIFWRTFTGLKRFFDHCSEAVGSQGFVTNPFGRRYYVDSKTPYKALNYMVQGTASEIMKRALINIENNLQNLLATKGIFAELLLTIHDEICVEGYLEDKKPVIDAIIEAMQGNFHEYLEMPQPFTAGVDICEVSWGEKEEVDMALLELEDYQ